MNLLFDRETLKVVGLNRPALPFEVSIENVEVKGLSKTVPDFETVNKSDEEGNQLFIYQPESVEVTTKIPTEIETIEKTDSLIFTTKLVDVPLLDDNEEQVFYYRTEEIETTEETDRPVFIEVYNEELGEYETIHKTNEDHEELFYKTVEVGEPIYCFTKEEVEVQKTDSEGNPLYLKVIENEVVTLEEQEPIEITSEDERYTEDLPKATNEQTVYKTVTFEEDSSIFTYDEIVEYKRTQLTKGTFFANSLLIESFDTQLFEENSIIDIGFDFCSLPSGGEALIKSIELKSPVKFVSVQLETSTNGLDVLIGPSEDELQDIVYGVNNIFTTPVSSLVIKIENPTDYRIDMKSISILY